MKILRIDEEEGSRVQLGLAQGEIATLFDTTKQNVSLHLRNVFKESELAETSVVKESLTTAADVWDVCSTWETPIRTVISIVYSG